MAQNVACRTSRAARRLLLGGVLLSLAVLPGPGRAEGPSEETTHYVFSWRGVPVGTVTLRWRPGRFVYTSRHLHTRQGEVGERVRQAVLEVDGQGALEGGGGVVPQALWLWRGPGAPGCLTGREELSGRQGPHCVNAVRGPWVEGTLLGAAFRARYDGAGRLEVLEVGESRFSAAPRGTRLRPPPDLFAQGVPVEDAGGDEAGVLAFEPPWPLPARPPGLTDWSEGGARALAAEVHQAFADKGPGAADWHPEGLGEAGGCLAHALRFSALARARGQRVALVHGLLAVDSGPARPHAWVRVGLRGGGALDLDPTSLEAVRPDTHLALALVGPEASAAGAGGEREAGERWLALLRGERRVVRRR